MSAGDGPRSAAALDMAPWCQLYRDLLMKKTKPPEAAPLGSGALCQAAGVTRGVLRVYEREGLLGPPPRTAAGYRVYPADSVQRLLAIRQLKEVGFTLREIALLLAERDVGRISPARVRKLAREQLGVIDQRIARLQVVREYAAAVAEGDLSVLDDPACGFLLHFLSAGAGPAAAAAAQPVPSAPAAPTKRRTAATSQS
jgi:DNA-binding transcriptional MerR regulator